MKKGIKRFLIGSGVVVGAAATAFAVTFSVTKKLVMVALDREEPKAIGKSKELITGNENIEETLKMQEMIAEYLENSDCETVEITAEDGTRLVGHLHRADNAKRTILAMHGWRSSWSKDFGIIADFFFDNDCNVLFAEQRGQGESGGEYMGFGLIERYDCLDWVKYINNNGLGEVPVYLAGISMGASTVLMTAGFKLPENVKGIIADCGFTSPNDIWRHVTNNMHLRYNGIRENMVDNMCKKKINFTSKDYSTIDAMKECEVPVLFIHGTDDKFVPISMTYENFKACVAPKRLFVVPGAAHGMSYIVDRKGYEDNLKQFWRDFDNNP